MAEHQDGIEDAPGKAPEGPGAGGQSEGGAYPNPHTGHGKDKGGFMGHGGQSENAYSGTGDAEEPEAGNANAVTKED